MPLYHFQSRDGAEAGDAVCFDLPNADAAKALGFQRAAALFATREQASWATRDWEQTVVDASGALLLRLEVKRTDPPSGTAP